MRQSYPAYDGPGAGSVPSRVWTTSGGEGNALCGAGGTTQRKPLILFLKWPARGLCIQEGGRLGPPAGIC